MQPHLHGGDVLEKVLDAAGAVACAPRAREGQQREEFAAVGLIAVDLHRRAGAGGRTVQHGAQVVVEEAAEEEHEPPAAPYPAGATGAECATRSVHAVTTQLSSFSLLQLRNRSRKREKMIFFLN